jgi:hypothetical protein
MRLYGRDRHVYMASVEKPEGKNMVDLGVDGRILLK